MNTAQQEHVEKGLKNLNDQHSRWQFDVSPAFMPMGILLVVATPKPVEVQKAIWEAERDKQQQWYDEHMQEASENEGYCQINKSFSFASWVPAYSIGNPTKGEWAEYAEFKPVTKVDCDLEKLGNDWVYSEMFSEELEIEGADWTVVNFGCINDHAAIFPVFVGKERIEEQRKYEESRLRGGHSCWHMMAHHGDEEFEKQRAEGTYDITKDTKVQKFNEIVLPAPIPTE